jgi:hypothetical protein
MTIGVIETVPAHTRVIRESALLRCTCGFVVHTVPELREDRREAHAGGMFVGWMGICDAMPSRAVRWGLRWHGTVRHRQEDDGFESPQPAMKFIAISPVDGAQLVSYTRTPTASLLILSSAMHTYL